MTKTTPTATKAQKSAIRAARQRAALSLVQPHAPGSISEAEAQRDAQTAVLEAVTLCARGNRRDLAEQLLAISAELRHPGSDLASALERYASETPAPRRRRKRPSKVSLGQRAKAKLVRRGAMQMPF